jgi:hypothetical protein
MMNANELHTVADKANAQKEQRIKDKARCFVKDKIYPTILERANEGLYQCDGKVADGISVDEVVNFLVDNQFQVNRNGRQLVIKW